MRWVASLAGWAVAGVVLVRYRRLIAVTTKLLAEANISLAEARELIESVYRVRLSCPLCSWTYDVIREDRESAMAAGGELISQHNITQGHIVGGQPRPGFYRGRPVN